MSLEIAFTQGGLAFRREALKNSVPIKITHFKISKDDIDMSNLPTDLPSSWIEKPITYYTPIGTAGLQLDMWVEANEAIEQGKSFGIYLEDGTCYMLGRAVGLFNPNLKQKYKVLIEFVNSDLSSYDLSFVENLQQDWDAIKNKPSFAIINKPTITVVENKASIGYSTDQNFNGVHDKTIIKLFEDGSRTNLLKEYEVTSGDVANVLLSDIPANTQLWGTLQVGSDNHLSDVVEFEFTSLKNPPNMENLLVTIPQSAYIGGSFNLSISGATSDNTFTYSVEGVDFAFSKNSNIAENEAITVSVSSSSIVETKTITIRAIDSNGSISDAFEKTIDIVAPTGSTEEFTTNTSIVIPKEATLLTARGKGVASYTYMSSPAATIYGVTINGVLRKLEALYVWMWFDGIKYNRVTGSAYTRDDGGDSSDYPKNITLSVIENRPAIYTTIPAKASTISGAIDVEFTSATEEEIIRVLEESTEDYTLSLTIPSGGMIQLEWE